MSWKGSGTAADPFRPDLPPEVQRFVDRTNLDLSGGLPARNFFIGEVIIQETEIGAMPGSEMWRDGKQQERPDESEKGRIRADLFGKLGLNPTDLDDIGLKPIDMGLPQDERPVQPTRLQITEKLIEKIRAL